MKKFHVAVLGMAALLAFAPAGWGDGETYNITEAGKHAIELTSGTATHTNITVTKSGDGSGENADFYGTNAAILASGGSTLTIKGSSTNITTDGKYANGVFAYGATVDISDATITTKSSNSGGIMTTGGGIMKASNLTITTSGGSSAAIRSDRGGGTVTVDGGTYTTSGTGSPAIYSTAAITVSDATLKSNAAQGVVVEGGNSVTLNNCTVNANHTTLNGQDTTHQAVMLYQSMSGDASDGASSFTMTGGTLTNSQGDIFHVTNVTSTINLTGATITNNDSSGAFLRATSDSWGTSGSNGGNVTLNASGQTITGDMVLDSVSSLTLNLKDNSTFTGAITAGSSASASGASIAASDGSVAVTIEAGSTWNMTGDSFVTTLTNNGTINKNGYTLTEGTTSDGSSSSGSSGNSGNSNSGNSGNSGSNSGNSSSSGKSGNSGCDAGLGALALAPLFLLRKRRF